MLLQCDNEDYDYDDQEEDEDRASQLSSPGRCGGPVGTISHPTALHPRFPLGIPIGPSPSGGVWPGGGGGAAPNGSTGSPFPWLSFRTPGMLHGPGGSK